MKQEEALKLISGTCLEIAQLTTKEADTHQEDYVNSVMKKISVIMGCLQQYNREF